jgi:hypothetical protein
MEQMRTMKYGMWAIGNHIAIKQRFTKDMLEMMMATYEMMQHSDSITIIMNRQGTHGHFAGVFHQDTHFGQTFARAKQRAKARLMIGKGMAMLQATTIECHSLTGNAQPVISKTPVLIEEDIDDLPF